MIAKADLKHGAYYAGRCRNASVARWNANTQRFIYWRSKFGFRFAEEIRHPDDDPVFDVFRAEREVEAPAEEIPLELSI